MGCCERLNRGELNGDRSVSGSQAPRLGIWKVCQQAVSLRVPLIPTIVLHVGPSVTGQENVRQLAVRYAQLAVDRSMRRAVANPSARRIFRSPLLMGDGQESAVSISHLSTRNSTTVSAKSGAHSMPD